MKKKIKSEKPIIIIFSIALFFIIILGSMNFMIFNKDFYHKEYAKNNVYENMPSGIDAKNVTSNIMKYFKGSEQLSYFTHQEKDHMRDVKVLIKIMQYIYYASAFCIIALFYYTYKKYTEDRVQFMRMLSRSLLWGSLSAIVFLILVFLFTVFSFDFFFTIFHLILFPQGNWMFDQSSLLITLFPQQFFIDISLRIFVYAMFQALIFFGIGYWMHRQLKIFEKFHL